MVTSHVLEAPLQVAAGRLLRSEVPGERAVVLVSARRVPQDVPYFIQALLTQHLDEAGDDGILYHF